MHSSYMAVCSCYDLERHASLAITALIRSVHSLGTRYLTYLAAKVAAIILNAALVPL